MKNIKKQLELTEDCVKTLAKIAIDKGVTFKKFAESILEKMAKKNNIKK